MRTIGNRHRYDLLTFIRQFNSSRKRPVLYLSILAVILGIVFVVLTPRSSALTNNGSITAFDATLTETFNTLAASGAGNVWADNSTIPGWYSSRPTYNAGDGSSNTGALYSFGTVASTDRALGSVGSSGTGAVLWGVKFTNNTGATITSIDISYFGEQWRNGGATSPNLSVAQTVDFQYQVANPGVITAINTPTTGWVDHDPLDFTSPTFGTSGATALDGNAPANRVAKSSTLTVNVLSGQEIWLRWRDIDHPGNDHALAVDDFSLTAHGAGATNPTGVGTANPNSVLAGDSTLLTVTVTPGTSPVSTGLAVTGDLSPIGGSATQQFFDDGSHGDVTPGNNVFSFNATVAAGTAAGAKILTTTVSDAQTRSSSAPINLTVVEPSPPTGVGSASPNPIQAGNSSLLAVAVTPGANPTSTGLTVVGDLSSIGGSATQTFFDNGTNGDVTAGDDTFSFNATVAAGTATGLKTLPIQINDAQSRIGNTSISLSVQGAPPVPGSVVISQVYGGGGNSGATLKNDFIEIINHTDSAIDLTGWSVQYASAALANWQVTPLNSFILQPGQYYLIREAAGAGGTVDLPTPDTNGSIAMGAGAGKIALVSNATALTAACPLDSVIIDFVGYGSTASCFEGSGPTPTLTNTTAALRGNNGCADTDNNASDFTAGAPNPRNSSSQTNNCAVLSGIGSANPTSVQPGDSSTLTVNVSPGSNPTSTGITVVADLSSIGGSATQYFAGNGNSFTFVATVSGATTMGQKSLPVTISDAQNRSASTTINLTVLQPPPPANHIVISQVYGGGGNPGPPAAVYANDFVELYNPGSIPFDLTGWSIQYAAFDGNGWGSNKQPLGGVISPGEYYLIKLGSGGGAGGDLPPANVEGDINLSAATGKIALVSSFQALTGTCPLADPNLVDFVGYGSSATTPGFCYEGSAGAPAGSNTVSVLRKNGGNTDTNNNNNDFVAGSPNPRRTAPIVELGPNVLSTDPTSNGFNTPHDASMTVTFTEPVDVVGAWYNISCTNSGPHNDATVASSTNFKTYVIIPNTNFQFGEQCTVTINKDAVHDKDSDDSGANTDTLPADYNWTFSVVDAGAPAPYPPSVHLTMGNPSNAAPYTSDPNNYLMEKPTYSLSYNRDKGTPNWVSWHLEPAWFGNLVRFDTFRPDPAVPPDWYRVLATDYSGSGFDRGHMTPNADRDNENRIPINQETYLMSNMVPQAPDNNQGPWASFENYLRSILTVDGEHEIYIVSGPEGVGGTGSNGGVTTTVANGHVTVPAQTWKVALVLPKGDNDISRVTCGSRAIAIIMPNVQGIRNDPWQNYLVSVDQVEALTGYDFFSNLPSSIQNCVESGVNGVNNHPGTEGQSVTTNEDTAVAITLTAVSPSNSALSYTIVSEPTHGILSGTDANRTYTPSSNYFGPDSFTFKVNDGANDSNVSTVNITVNSVNDNPDAVDDSPTVSEDSGANNINVLANDTDVDGGTLSVIGVTQGTSGSVTIASGGSSVTYTPSANFFGSDSFTYTISDGQGGSDTATVNITVTNVNDAPVANGENYVTNSNTPLNVPTPGVLSNDTDIDGPTLSSVLVSGSGPSHGTLTLNPNGSFTYTPFADYTGGDSFSYRAFDGIDYSNAATVNITVNDTVPPALTAAVATPVLSTTNSTLVNVGLTASATDNSGGPVTIQVAVFGDEDDQTPTVNNTVHSPDAKDIALNTLRLRGERVEANDGRVYLIILTATDTSGNVSRNYLTVVVPKSSKQANIDIVNSQAAAAVSYAQSHGGAPPPNYFVIGDGPIIGPKQ